MYIFIVTEKIGDKVWRSNEQIDARKQRLDAAMAKVLSQSEPLPNITQQNLVDAANKLPTNFGSALEKIQSRLDIATFSAGKKDVAQNILQKTDNEIAAKTVGLWKNSSEIAPNEMQKFSNSVKAETQTYLKEFLKNPENFSDNEPNIATQLYKDASRQIVTIEGNTFKGTDDNAGLDTINKFKEVVKDDKSRRLLSSLMSQTSLGSISTALHSGTMVDEKGYIPKGMPKGTDDFIIGGGASTGKEEYYTNIDLKLSGKQKDNPDRATVTVMQKIPIQCMESNDPNDKIAGNINVKVIQECKLGKNPELTDIKVEFTIEGPNSDKVKADVLKNLSSDSIAKMENIITNLKV